MPYYLKMIITLCGLACVFMSTPADAYDCSQEAPTEISVLPLKSTVKYDFTKTKAQLNQVDVDTVSPYGPHHKTNVSGLMSGAIQLKSQIAFSQRDNLRKRQGCFYIKSIELSIRVDPTIFVAREHPKGSCMHNAVLTHEYKHVREDQLVMNKYSYILENALKRALKSKGESFGPYEIERIPHIQQNIQNFFATVIKQYTRKMNEERQRRQQAIDNLEEYESIGKKCKSQRRR